MKRLFYILILITGMTNAQIVDIPDANFKATLLLANTTNGIAQNSQGVYIVIDTNANGEIEESEALEVSDLYLNNRNISSLQGIEYFTNISLLDCSYNQIMTLDLTNNLNIQNLISSHNTISNAVLPNFNYPTVIDLSYNSLSNINLINLSQIVSLFLNNNNLTSIVFDNPNFTFLVDGGISVSNNPLVNLDMGQLRNSPLVFGDPFNEIGVSNTFITQLICPSAYVKYYEISNNPNLEFISFKNQKLESFVDNDFDTGLIITNNPNLNKICIDDLSGVLTTEQQFFENYFNNSSIQFSTYCSFTPGGDYNTITGAVTFDANNNGCDANDIFQPNIRVNINDSINQGATFTNTTGNYNFYTQAGSFDLTPNVENPTYFNFSPTTATIPFANNNNNTATQNFCISANGIHPDVEIVIAPITPARPGFDATYKIVYKNKGNQTLSGNVGFTYDDAVLDFVSATVVPNSQSVGTLSWNYTNLLPFESRSIVITLNVNAPTETPAVNIGDVLNFSASVNPIAGDEIPSDNTFNYNETVVGSYDPNDITCLEGDIVSPSEIGNYLHYNIRFENTGTAPAEFVVVKVEVNETDFDMNSLQIMNSSDPVFARINQNIVEFIFQNIQLESGGHGNILLKIKSKNNLLVGDEVNKKANIYFDYNFPILTNDAETVFQALNNPDFQNDASISVYPNPTNGIVTVTCNNSIKSIELYDVQGRLLQTNLVNENETTIDVSTKAKGVYFLKILSDKGMKVEKIVRE
jgi:hypothetical protein